MKNEHEDRIEYVKPELVDLDGGEGIAGVALMCRDGESALTACSTGFAAGGSGCNGGADANCSTGSVVGS